MANSGLGFSASSGGGKWVNGEAQFKERDGKWAVKFKTGETFHFSSDKLPKYPEKIAVDATAYFVSIMLDESEKNVEQVRSIRPMRWKDELMLVTDCTRVDDIPSFYSKTSNFDTNKEVVQVNWMLEFVDKESPYFGVQVPYNIHYRFTVGDDGNAVWDFSEYQMNHPKATRIRQCVEFYVEQMGVLSPERPVEWPDDGNIIPELLARIKANKRYIRTFGKEGWIQDIDVDKEMNANPPAVVDNSPIPSEESPFNGDDWFE